MCEREKKRDSLEIEKFESVFERGRNVYLTEIEREREN